MIYLQSNILINTAGHAHLSDYGLSLIQAKFQGTSYHTSMLDGAVLWAAPELYHMPDSHEAVEEGQNIALSVILQVSPSLGSVWNA
jgi:hypothetical protein